MTLITMQSQAEASPGFDCDKWRDSMVVAGVRSLAHEDISAARRHFTAAYRCGMSKDSMYYFAAEIYLRSGAPDTALTFNWALEKGGHFDRAVYLEQRVRIYRSVGWNHAADSVEALYRKKTRHDINLSVSGTRNSMALERITIFPQQILLDPPDDIDDAGTCGLKYRWSYYTAGLFKKCFLQLNVNTQTPVPSPYSFDDGNDTLMRTVSISLGGGNLPFTPEFVSSYRARIHDDGKTDHYLKGTFSLIAGKRGILSAEHQLKLIRNEGVDDARTGLSLMSVPKGRNIKRSFGVTVAHHFAKTATYDSQLDVWGRRSTIPIGFVDSLNYGNNYYNYYRDRNLSVPFTSPFLDEYWKDQPGLVLLENQEHDLNATVNASFRFPLPLQLKLNLFCFFQTVWYPKKVRYYTFDDPIIAFYDDLYENYALLYNADDGKYYLNSDRSSRTTPDAPFKEVHFRLHEKRRVDNFFSLGIILERRFRMIGKVYVSATWLKCFSTMNENDPVAILDYMWMVRTAWEMGFSFGRK